MSKRQNLRFTITLPEDLGDLIRDVCFDKGMGVSQLIEELIQSLHHLNVPEHKIVLHSPFVNPASLHPTPVTCRFKGGKRFTDRRDK